MIVKKKFSLNNETLEFSPGETVMTSAMQAGKYIPHLCYHPDYEPHGSCRLCMVKINGKLVSACTTPVREGMSVESESPELANYRKTLLQMIFVEGNHVCPACEKSGSCELQALAYREGMLSPHFSHFFPTNEIDASHPDFVIDFDRCILCELCVRASDLKDKKQVFSISGRGGESRLTINCDSGKLADTRFSAGDEAAKICPVGAILPKYVAYRTPIGDRQYDRYPIDVAGDSNHD